MSIHHPIFADSDSTISAEIEKTHGRATPRGRTNVANLLQLGLGGKPFVRNQHQERAAAPSRERCLLRPHGGVRGAFSAPTTGILETSARTNALGWAARLDARALRHRPQPQHALQLTFGSATQHRCWLAPVRADLQRRLAPRGYLANPARVRRAARRIRLLGRDRLLLLAATARQRFQLCQGSGGLA